jgi:hypothetical protein
MAHRFNNLAPSRENLLSGLGRQRNLIVDESGTKHCAPELELMLGLVTWNQEEPGRR